MILPHAGVVGVPDYQIFRKRWRALFGAMSWWQSICDQYYRTRDDDDGGVGAEAIEQLLYERAKIANLDTTQTCPHCRKVVDQAASVGDHDDLWCHTCLLDAERDDSEWEEIEARREAMTKALHDAWLASLPADERAAYQRAAAQAIEYFTAGLFTRDVQ